MQHTLTRTPVYRLIVVFLVLFSAPELIRAQLGATTDRISIIPQPREMAATTEPFRLDRRTHITLADPRSADDRFAAADFIEDVKQTARVTLTTSRNRGHKTILIGLIELPVIQSALNSAAVAVSPHLHDEGYGFSGDT